MGDMGFTTNYQGSNNVGTYLTCTWSSIFTACNFVTRILMMQIRNIAFIYKKRAYGFLYV